MQRFPGSVVFALALIACTAQSYPTWSLESSLNTWLHRVRILRLFVLRSLPHRTPGIPLSDRVDISYPSSRYLSVIVSGTLSRLRKKQDRHGREYEHQYADDGQYDYLPLGQERSAYHRSKSS